MVQFNINTEELPLGKLSQQHLREGFAVLSDIAELLSQPQDAKRDALLRDQSSRFATVIPQVAPQAILTQEQLAEKIAMLEALRDMELAAKLVGTPGSAVGACALGRGRSRSHPLLACAPALRHRSPAVPEPIPRAVASTLLTARQAHAATTER